MINKNVEIQDKKSFGKDFQRIVTDWIKFYSKDAYECKELFGVPMKNAINEIENQSDLGIHFMEEWYRMVLTLCYNDKGDD